MWKKMNLPNKLTMLRILLIPLFVIAMCLPTEWVWPIYTALGIYIVAALTDFLDGHISRSKGLVTKFGKIMDPLADKLLVSTGFIMLTGAGIIPSWITVIIVFRDFFINALRMFGTDNNKDLAASLSGKIKTLFQLVGIPLGILNVALLPEYGFGAFIENAAKMDMLSLMVNIFMTVSISAAVIATLWSFVAYCIRFKSDIDYEN
ncbi:MAG: CDP-diacylglycerol--glycerol-3-phosphate 3-phosphatidyltransferase [Clostridia bacterium]|nr:CDP-diacylglycerol--glycerol-3-phosphate 3-phosphatidyltransferase [Clostridia bacterium]